MIRPLPAPRGVTIVRGGGVTSPKGFVAGGVAAGIKAARGALDVGLLASEFPCASAAMFTRNRVVSNAVRVSAMHARGQSCRAIAVNSGCSNVATGEGGLRDALEMCELAAVNAGVPAAVVIVGSTGVIGRPLPMTKVRTGLRRVELSRGGGHDFARANMTTDTFAKEVAVRVRSGHDDYVIGGCAKGSGMVHPDMATMFCWLTTDAAVDRRFLAYVLRAAVEDTLNMLSVDGDTSTSDTTAILANGAAGGVKIEQGTPRGVAVERALRYVCTSLARMLARDGEGAGKLIEVRIEGAANDREARAAARAVTASPLVKSAVHGNDPNWGRVLMAIGRSGARIELARARVWLGQAAVYRGAPVKYDERAASRYLRSEEVLLRAHLGAGAARATAWGCDLTPEYVRINSDYTT